MKRTTILLLISAVIVTLLMLVAENFIIGPVLALIVGDTFAEFIVTVIVIAVILKVDDVFIVPLAEAIFKKMGLERFVRIE